MHTMLGLAGSSQFLSKVKVQNAYNSSVQNELNQAKKEDKLAQDPTDFDNIEPELFE